MRRFNATADPRANRRRPAADDYGIIDVADPYQRLLLAVMLLAVRDVLYGRPAQAEAAREYLSGPNFRADCDMLGINPARVLSRVAEKERFMHRTLSDDAVRQIHAEYWADPTLSMSEVARRHDASITTLSRYFSRLGLPTRGHSHPGRGGPRRPPPADAIRELADLLAGLGDGAAVHVTIHVEVKQ